MALNLMVLPGVLFFRKPCCLEKGASCRRNGDLSPPLVTGTGAQRPGCVERLTIPRENHEVSDGC